MKQTSNYTSPHILSWRIKIPCLEQWKFAVTHSKCVVLTFLVFYSFLYVHLQPLSLLLSTLSTQRIHCVKRPGSDRVRNPLKPSVWQVDMNRTAGDSPASREQCIKLIFSPFVFHYLKPWLVQVPGWSSLVLQRNWNVYFWSLIFISTSHVLREWNPRRFLHNCQHLPVWWD